MKNLDIYEEPISIEALEQGRQGVNTTRFHEIVGGIFSFALFQLSFLRYLIPRNQDIFMTQNIYDYPAYTIHLTSIILVFIILCFSCMRKRTEWAYIFGVSSILLPVLSLGYNIMFLDLSYRSVQHTHYIYPFSMGVYCCLAYFYAWGILDEYKKDIKFYLDAKVAACLDIQGWMENPIIDIYRKAVIAQGRVFVNGEIQLMKDWISMQEEEKWNQKIKEACRVVYTAL